LYKQIASHTASIGSLFSWKDKEKGRQKACAMGLPWRQEELSGHHGHLPGQERTVTGWAAKQERRMGQEWDAVAGEKKKKRTAVAAY